MKLTLIDAVKIQNFVKSEYKKATDAFVEAKDAGNVSVEVSEKFHTWGKIDGIVNSNITTNNYYKTKDFDTLSFYRNIIGNRNSAKTSFEDKKYSEDNRIYFEVMFKVYDLVLQKALDGEFDFDTGTQRDLVIM